MSTTTDNVIHVLSNELANKIAAGEVVERPASVVKELLDNAIDSGADSIRVLVMNAGRSMIQVTDNGCGLSKGDIPLCFQRHATSKISTVEDLYNIHTLGFRGEAMASISSVAHVNLKSRRIGDETGWEYDIRGGKPSDIIPAATEPGTTVSVKNLFFNVPARRAFLKTDATELRHIIITVQQAALAHPEISFELNDDKESIYKLPASSLADRIAGIFGKSYKASLIPVQESTSVVSLKGYLIDPKMAKKNRGEQFLFVNGRPFMHRHLNYIIQSVYSTWIGKEQYPFYALFFEVDPQKVDVNVHPTKLEVKFDDERSVSTFTKSIIKRALNERFQVPEVSGGVFGGETPGGGASGAFSFESGFSAPRDSFSNRYQRGPDRAGFQQSGVSGMEIMEKLYPSGGNEDSDNQRGGADGNDFENPLLSRHQKPQEKHYDRGRGFWQLHDHYVISQTRSGMFIVDQYFAHMRIIYEKALSSTESGLPSTQQLLFAQSIDFSASDFALLKEVLPTLKKIGFNIQLLSGNSALVSGVPADLNMGDEKPIIETILQEYQSYSGPVKLSHKEKLVMSFASKAAIPRGKKLSQVEMEALIDQLFACDNPFLDPLNRPTTVFIPLEDIHKRFK